MKQYFEYLNALRDSGVTNMYGATPFLQEKFPELRHDPRRAREILVAWMESFSEGQGDES